MTPTETQRIDLSDPLQEICRRLDIPYAYVKEIVFRPATTHVVLYQGQDGRGRGGKFIAADGAPAVETLVFETIS